jgi:patatin-like phospholipase/acyl hydrolase
MRGIYTATYLDRVGAAFAKRRGVDALDIGSAFNLIVGTSTGAIIACGLAHGVAPKDMTKLYREQGTAIFPLPVPTGILPVIPDHLQRPKALRSASEALRQALCNVFGDATLGEVYRRRGIALAIPAVEMSQHRSWVFKTPHLAGTSSRRDDDYSLVDVCLVFRL